MISTAFIHIWGKRAGAIAWDPATGIASWEYEPAFLEYNWDLAPLKMPLKDARGRIFSFPELSRNNTFKGLPGLLADVLPDKYGNALINAWLSIQGRASDSMNPVELLCFIGKRGMGALEFEPVQPKRADVPTQLEISSLLEMAEKVLSGRESFHTSLAAQEEKALLDILKIGTSAGGARAKAVVAFHPYTKELRSGQTKAPEGFEHWLIKFDGVTDNQIGISKGYGRVEMAYYLMARDCEIDMMECRLLEENGRAHFMTRRFDRGPRGEKIHLQSFCAMQHYDFNEISSYSYEQLFETMRMLRLPYPQAEQLYRRMVFNVMARNCDDHTKNFAFVMNRDGKWALSPAYDVCHAYRPDSIWVSRQSLSVNGKRSNITRNDLLEVARQMNIKKAVEIIDQVAGVIQRWNLYAAETGVDTPLKDAIRSTLLQL